MTYSQTILPEFDLETANARRALVCVPQDKLDWKADAKGHTIGWNANHLAEILGWVPGILMEASWDFLPAGGPAYQSPRLGSCGEILELFDRNAAAARRAIAGVKDEEMAQPWSLLKSGVPLFTLPRATVLRRFVLNHLIHHRAILCVYLRLNGVTAPGMYDPTGNK